MFAAVWPSVQGGRERAHAGWLVAFCAARLLMAVQPVVFASSPAFDESAAILSGMLLWEFARRMRNDGGAPRIGAATHLFAAEALALLMASHLGGGTARGTSFVPLQLLVVLLPGMLGGGTLWLVWKSTAATAPKARCGLGLAVFGLAAHGLPAGPATILVPWIAALGLALVCFADPAARTKAALAWLGGAAVVAVLGPIAMRDNRSDEADWLARVQKAAAPLQGRIAGELAAGQVTETLRRQLEHLHQAEPLAHTAAVWRQRDGRIEIWDASSGHFVVPNPPAGRDSAGFAQSRAFLRRIQGGAFVTAFAPLIPGRFESPAGWLALEFPEVHWSLQRVQARRMGFAAVGLLAAFCAVGFVLTVRGQVESSQRIELERAQAADRAKTEFLAFLGHELRTPLQTILGRAEQLRGHADASHHANAIEAQGALLLRLVNDLLDLGTIEAGHFRLNAQPFSLRASLAAVEDALRAPAETKRLALSVIIDQAVPDCLLGDEARIRQVLLNLLANAVKYTPAGSVRLEVASQAADNATSAALVFRVLDTGPGLPPDRLPQLFTLFTRLDAGNTFTREGTGVGLALVRRLCTAMGGTVTATNRPEGGAEFMVRLALPIAQECRRASAETAAASSHHPATVLVAEDHTATRELLDEALTAAGHTVISVADGRAALAAADAQLLDAAVLDVNLPAVDGIAVARRLRATHPSVRIIGCSAEALPHIRETAFASGFDAFFVKPVPLQELVLAVAQAHPPQGKLDIFANLFSARRVEETYVTLLREWPRLRADAEAALSAGDTAAPRRLAHYLKSSALLARDETLLRLCDRLSGPAANGATAASAVVTDIDAHLRQHATGGAVSAGLNTTP